MHQTASTNISTISIVVAGGVSLLYLLTRPHLTGEQKFVAPMVGLAAGVPIGDLLAIAVGVTVFVKICPVRLFLRQGVDLLVNCYPVIYCDGRCRQSGVERWRHKGATSGGIAG